LNKEIIMKNLKFSWRNMLGISSLLILLVLTASASAAGNYGIKIFKTESALYPFVQIYFRTFDQDQQPLVNLNELNIGLMVKGRSYDPMKRQYFIQSLAQREEATRSVLVLDGSGSMRGRPFEASLRAATQFIDSKRPQDEIGILLINDTKEGYELVSSFDRDPGVLGRRLADVRATAKNTRLYDSVGAALEMCGMSAQGSNSPGIENYIVSCSILVFSDGKDEGSALTRQELMTRITGLPIPPPIYSLAYTNTSSRYFKNLEALSKNSFGKYYLIGETYNRMQRVVDEIQNILRNDYVVTFRAYVPVDGEEHAYKLGVDYPSRSGKYIYQSAHFEAIEPPPVEAINQAMAKLSGYLPELPDNNPYFSRQGSGG